MCLVRCSHRTKHSNTPNYWIGNSVCVSQLADRACCLRWNSLVLLWIISNGTPTILSTYFSSSSSSSMYYILSFISSGTATRFNFKTTTQWIQLYVCIIVKCPGLYKHHNSQATSFVLILLCLNSIRIRCFISRNYYLLLLFLMVCDRRCMQSNTALVRQTATAYPRR